MQIHRDIKYIRVYQKLKEERMRIYCLMATELLSEMMNKFVNRWG